MTIEINTEQRIRQKKKSGLIWIALVAAAVCAVAIPSLTYLLWLPGSSSGSTGEFRASWPADAKKVANHIEYKWPSCKVEKYVGQVEHGGKAYHSFVVYNEVLGTAKRHRLSFRITDDGNFDQLPTALEKEL